MKPFQEYTPLYRALEEDKYIRRYFLEEIKKAFRVKAVIAYISSPSASIDDIDPIAFEDLLYDYRGKLSSILLILHSYGGSPDIAEKLVETIRDKVKKFYIVVPEKAKSAATLLSLGSDKIFMLENAELGPIDPQIRLEDNTWRPAQSIIDGYKSLLELATNVQDSHIKALLIHKLDPSLLDFCEKTIQHATVIAQKLLEKYMLKGNVQKAEEIAKKLADARFFLSHGRPIRWDFAKDLGLEVEVIKRHKKRYELVWRYFTYAITHLAKGKFRKLFENNNKVSLLF